MAKAKHSWLSVFVGGLAVAGIIGAGLHIVRQLQPRPPDVAAPPVPPGVLQERWPDRNRRLLAKMHGSAQRVEGPVAKIVPAHLAWEDASGRGGLLDDIYGCLPAGPDVDVVWNRGQLYLMKKKGHLTLVFAADDVNDFFGFSEAGNTSVCFDGRYVWAALTRNAKTPLLIVLEPQSSQTWTLGAEEGLPVEPTAANSQLRSMKYFAIGAIAPGKAFLASPSGPAQLAIVEFDPKTGAKFAILSPGKRVSSGVAASQTPENNLKLQLGHNFRPVAIFNLTPPARLGDEAKHRIAVSCGSNLSPVRGPLLIDPITQSIEASASNATGSPVNNSRLANVDGAMYWIERLSSEPSRFVLVRAGSPKLEEEFLFDGMPEGNPVPYRDGIAFLGEQCWLWKPGESQIKSLDAQVPWIYRSHIDPGAPPPPRKIAGEEWQLDEVFASQHYGVLVKARKFVRPNAYFGTFLFFQFGLADDSRIAPEPSRVADRPQLAVELPSGTAASELRVFAAQVENQSPQANFGKTIEADPDDKLRFPIMAREIVRQALLIAARDQLQWTTRDEVLCEGAPPKEEQPAATWVLSTRFPYAGPAELSLQSVDGDGKANDIWKERITLNEDENHPLDYGALVESAERWSREAFPALLKRGELNGEPNPISDDAEVSPAAAEWLKQMTFTAQFAVLRELHHAIRQQGESPELLGGLSRAYANLGVLSEFHWNSMHKACKARALLYAQRLVAGNAQSASALWHRAYAKALIGLYDSAVADLDAAAKLPPSGDKADERPRWVEVVDACCRFDADKLAAAAENKNEEFAQLAGLLQFFQLEGLKESAAVQALAQRLMQDNPECFRLYDAMCDSCALSTLHVATQMAPAVLHGTVPRRLQELSGLPPDTAELLKRAAIRELNLTEVSESLLKTADEDDHGEFSWRILGRMLQEVEFIQLWRRVFFMRFQWAVPTDDFISAIESVATGHRYRALIDLCATDARRWQAAAEEVTNRLELAELENQQQAAFQKALGDAWKTRWTEQFVQAERRPALHNDDVHRDLLARMEREHWRAPHNLSECLMRVSSGSPDAVAAKIRQHHNSSPEELAALERKFPRQPQVLKLLSQSNGAPEDRKRRLREYIKVSPDTWAFRALAELYRREGNLDEWKAVLDECLQQPEFGLDHAKLRVDIATIYMDRGEWEQARPYAEQAAESWAEWAIICAIRCYRGLGEDELEGTWRSRIVERYPKTNHWLDYYVWTRRTGSPETERLLQAVDPMMAAAAPRFDAESQYMVGLFYQLSKRPKEAMAAYRKGADGHLDARQTSFDCLSMAVIAEELGEATIRDQALQRVVKLAAPNTTQFVRLAEWLQACWRSNASQQPDLDVARQIAADAEGKDRTGINCFIGRALELRGRFEAAVEFYQAAASEPAGRMTATYSLVCAVLRDHGIDPGKSVSRAEPTSSQRLGE